jgi:hypothetical protein
VATLTRSARGAAGVTQTRRGMETEVRTPGPGIIQSSPHHASVCMWHDNDGQKQGSETQVDQDAVRVNTERFVNSSLRTPLKLRRLAVPASGDSSVFLRLRPGLPPRSS